MKFSKTENILYVYKICIYVCKKLFVLLYLHTNKEPKFKQEFGKLKIPFIKVTIVIRN